MRRILALLFIGASMANPGAAEEYLLCRNLEMSPPRLGDGFDPAQRPARRVRLTAVQFTPDVRRHSALQASVSIYELDETCNALADRDASASTALKHVLQAELRLQDHASVFEQHSVFVVQAMLINRSESASAMQFKEEAAALPEDIFRCNYGVRFVDRIDYGGHIYLLYVFRTRKDEVRRKIISSLQAAYADVTEKATFTDHLEKYGVRAEFTMHTVQDGGDIAPFLNPNIAEFRTYLERWTPSVAKHPTAVRFYTSRYHDALADFPHRWRLGFGQTYGY